MKVKVVQSYLTVCDPMDYTVHGILQAIIPEWVAFPFSRDLPNAGIKPRSPILQADSLPAEPPRKPDPSQTLPKKMERKQHSQRHSMKQSLP